MCSSDLIGAGLCFALACDLRLAAEGAKLAVNFVKLGLHPGMGATWLLPRLVGPARARGLALTAEPIAAETAADWGMIWKVVDDDRLIAEAEALCAQLAAGPRFGLALIKRALDAADQNGLDAQLDLERDLQRQAGFHPDYGEGVRAFMEKRAPNFAGRRSG